MPLTLFEQARQEIGSLIMDNNDHNGNDLTDFIVLSQIAFNWIMDMVVEPSVKGNAAFFLAIILTQSISGLVYL